MILRHAAPRRGAKTGVADYAEALHSAMAAAGDIRWEGNAGIWLYHIGNNSLHRDLYRRAIAQPGIVILHDAVLHHLFLGLLNEEEYTEEFVYNYGEWNRHLAARLWKRRSGSAGDAAYFAYPMLRRLTERSRLIVVHNHRAAAMVSAHGRDVRVEVIPHLAGAPNRSSEASAELRAKWGNGAVFGIFGHLRPSKRLASVFDAVQRVPGARVLVAGEFVDRQFGDALSNEMAGSRAIHLRFGNAQELDERISAVDAVINLRVPSAGETSGISIRR